MTERECAELSCAAFFGEFLQRGVPVLVHGHLHAEEWTALVYFSDLRRLCSTHGSVLVPVSPSSPSNSHTRQRAVAA